MDILTQGLLGANLAQSAAPAREARTAALVGALAGLLPDADALIRKGEDPLFFLEFHRHFSHALVFVPVGALVAALMLWPCLRSRMGFAHLLGYAFLGYALAGLLDACTSYGTHLWWPFSDERVAWSIIAIVDPAFTLTLLAAAALGVRRRSPLPARIALLLCAAYLGLGIIQHQRARALAQDLIAARGHAAERLIVKPTIANQMLWRSLYLHDGRLYADGLRLGLTGTRRVYGGESQPLLRADASPEADGHQRDLARFARFADGLLVRHPARPDMVGDARYAMLPTSLRPIWGIVRNEPGAGAETAFVTDRSMSEAERDRFVDMLLGRDRGSTALE